MKKVNVWEIVSKESESIIKAIEKGEVKTRKDYMEYLETVYNWRIYDVIEDIVSAYLRLNSIDMPVDNETPETAE